MEKRRILIKEQCQNKSPSYISKSEGGHLDNLIYYKAIKVLLCPVLKGK